MPLRGIYLIVAAIIVGVLVALLPLPGALGTLGYIAAVILMVVGLVFLVVDLLARRGPREPHI